MYGGTDRRSGRPPVLDLLLVGASGSPLTQLAALEPWSRRHRRWWVCSPSPQAHGVLRGERVCWSLQDPDRPAGPLAAPRTALAQAGALGANLGLAWRALRSGRPDVVLATGAVTAVPFLALARLARVPAVYLESCDRPELPSAAHRACRRLASRTLVQWEEQADLDPDADVVGCLL